VVAASRFVGEELSVAFGRACRGDRCIEAKGLGGAFRRQKFDRTVAGAGCGDEILPARSG
jgi:hypothetical protein